MIQLRDYQKQAKAGIRSAFMEKKQRVILQLPTGGGKTVIFTDIAKSVADNNKTAIVFTDRKELLKQAGSTFEKFGLEPRYLNAEAKKVEPGYLYVAMIETMKRRIDKPGYETFIQSFDLIIIDEAHKQNFDKIFQYLTSNQFVIGATATPYRDGKMKPLKDYYDKIIIGQQIGQLIATNHLSDVIHYGVPIAGLENVKITRGEFDEKQMGELYDNPVLYTGVLINYQKHCFGKKALLFCATVKNSISMTEQFNQAGIKANHIDANTPKAERDKILTSFKNNEFKVLSNVGILTTGYDQPDIEVIITYRATRSLPLWLQMCGRGSRTAQGKDKFIILDFGENTKRHGFWNDDRIWTLENAKPPKKKGAAPVKECKGCGALIHASVMVCPYCMYEYPVKIETKSYVEVVLEQLTPTEINRKHWDNIWELEKVRELKGYKIGWVLRRLKTFSDFEDYARLKGYKKGWIFFNYKKYLAND
jgi:superfamily II DNA or RNA helicase